MTRHMHYIGVLCFMVPGRAPSIKINIVISLELHTGTHNDSHAITGDLWDVFCKLYKDKLPR